MNEKEYFMSYSTGKITVGSIMRLFEQLIGAGKFDDPHQEIHVAFGNNTFIVGVKK